MQGHIYATEALARRAIAAIDGARPAIETLRGPNGVTFAAPARTWCIDPIPLRDGTWFVPWKRRLRPYQGAVVDVDGTPEVVPLESAAVTRTDGDTDPNVAPTRAR